MDFATLKAYMTSASYKENANTTMDCVQKRLDFNQVERKSNRNVRLTQFRNIPENMSACNTPQVMRTVHTLEVPKRAVNITTSKLYEDKRKIRMQRLREFKEKRENLKLEEAANKKPLFKVTHASAEKYDLDKIYNFNKGIPILPSKETYKFSAPKNVRAISFLKKDSPRKRVTRSATRLLSNTLKEDVKTIKNATNQLKLTRNASKHALDESKHVHEKMNSPRNCKKPNKNQYADNTPKKVDKTSKSHQKTAVLEEMSSSTKVPKVVIKPSSFEVPKVVIKPLSFEVPKVVIKPLSFEVPKVVIKTDIRNGDANTEATISDTSSTVKREKSKRIVKTGRNTRAEENLTDTTVPSSILCEELHTSPVKNKVEKMITRQSTKIPVRTPSKVEINQQMTPAKAQDKVKTPAKMNAHFNIEDDSNGDCDIFVKTPAKVQNIAKTPKSLRKSKRKDAGLKTEHFIEKSTSTLNEDATTSKKLKINPNKTNIKSDIDEEYLKTNKSPSERRLRSKSTDVHEEELVKSSLKSKKIKSTTSKVQKSFSKLNKNIECEIDLLSPIITNKKPTVQKTLVKELNGSATSKDVVEDFGAYNIENNVNEANIAKRMSCIKTPENLNVGLGEAGENCVYISPFVTVSRGKQRARDEYTQRQNSGGTINSPAFQQSTSVKTAAEFFTLLLNKETTVINNSCDFWNTFKNENNVPEEALDMIDVATGQATLLKNKKMTSFRNLIQYSLEKETDKPVTCMDLHGFWDVLNMQIENVNTRFENLLKLRDNNWVEILPEKPKKVIAAKKVAKPLANMKRSNMLREAIKSARLRSMAKSSDLSDDNKKTPKSDRKSKKHSIGSAKGSHKRISALSNNTPRKSISSPRCSSPHIMMQVSQVAKSVDRLGSEAVQSAKSILKKRQSFKECGKKPKVVLFDVSDDVIEDYVSARDNDNITAKISPFVRRSTRLQ